MAEMIYNDWLRGRWPLHLLEPVPKSRNLQFFTIYEDKCPTAYAKPMTTDPATFLAAKERGREVCPRCEERLDARNT